MDSVAVTNEGGLVDKEMMNSAVIMNELMNMDPQNKATCHRTFNTSHSDANHVSYLAKSEVDSKGVHHVNDSGWKRVSAIMDSGSAECVVSETIARNIPLMETETSRQGQTYHAADGGVIKNKVKRQ